MFNNIFENVQGIILGILGLVILVAGVRLAGKAHKANYAETARVGFNTVVAIVVASIGLGAFGFAIFGKKILTALGLI